MLERPLEDVAAHETGRGASFKTATRRRLGSPGTSATLGTMDRGEMLRALQNDVDAWPQRVKDAGVTNKGGWAYVPLPRNNGVLRTPQDPEATLRYMIDVWQKADAEQGSEGWDRIIAQVGPTHTWEYLMIDETRPYASLFPQAVRDRVRAAMDASAGSAAWGGRQEADRATQQARANRIQEIREEMRQGTRKRLNLPDLDSNR